MEINIMSTDPQGNGRGYEQRIYIMSTQPQGNGKGYIQSILILCPRSHRVMEEGTVCQNDINLICPRSYRVLEKGMSKGY